ncbi:MAG: cobalt-precorrin-5B (C(1))-methyltransferase CbiD, partial [Alphaproteobacteria bacterium]
LPIPVGEPAISPKPRASMVATLAEVAARHQGRADLRVTIAIPGGEALARRTSNPRLGILGGLSILGTTGIVIPYSCSSWIHSIHRGIDVARAGGLTHLAAATGRTSEAAVQKLYDLPDRALLEMGDFAGATLKYLRRQPVPRLTIAGGFAKLSKLARGEMDLHSDRSQVDVGGLAQMLSKLGAPPHALARAASAVSAGAILAIADEVEIPIADHIAAGARTVALAALPGGTAVDFVVTDRSGRIIGRAGI